jgi:hypothetical protein
MQIDPVSSSHNQVIAATRKTSQNNQGPAGGADLDVVDTDAAKQIGEIAAEYDVRNISPRDMVELSESLYGAGHISFETHAMLSFQPELHPEYDSTLGRMSGSPARPDEARDFIQVWEDMLEEKKDAAAPAEQIKLTEEVLNVLRNLAAIRDLDQ